MSPVECRGGKHVAREVPRKGSGPRSIMATLVIETADPDPSSSEKSSSAISSRYKPRETEWTHRPTHELLRLFTFGTKSSEPASEVGCGLDPDVWSLAKPYNTHEPSPGLLGLFPAPLGAMAAVNSRLLSQKQD